MTGTKQTVTKQAVTKQTAATQIATKQTVTKQSATKWGAALHIPDAVTTGGQDWNVRRAWPAGDSRIAWEASLPGQGTRVGYLDERGVTALDPDRDPKLPGLAGLLEDGGRLVSHRPGRRAVVRLRDGSFAKCVRDGKASDVIAGQCRAVGFLPGFALPQVLSSDSSTVVLSVVPGVELHDPAELGEEWSRAWAESLDAWAQAKAHPTNTVPAAAPKLSTAMPFHGAADEVEVLHLWRERARPLLETTRTARGETLLADVDELITEVTAELDDETASARDGSIGLIHRDLHDKQIMWDPISGPGLLDVDTACRGERALDLGNLRAHARWRTEQGLWTPAEAAVVIDEIARVASAGGFDPARVSVYERATLIRLVCVYAFRPAWSDRIGWLLEAAQAM